MNENKTNINWEITYYDNKTQVPFRITSINVVYYIYEGMKCYEK